VTLWITLALILHTFGMLGIYSEVWWYDHVTHALSWRFLPSRRYLGRWC